MRILVVTQYFYPENVRINDVCLGLVERGHSVTVLTGKPNYPSGKYFEGYNWFSKSYELWKEIDVYRSNLILRGNGNAINLILNYFSFAFLSIFKLFFIKSSFDKIFIFAPSPITVAFPGIVAAKLFKAESILWVHDLWPESIRIAGGIENEFIIKSVDCMTRWIYRKMDKILIQSEAFESYIHRQIKDKSKIIYYPFYAESFYQVENPSLKYVADLPGGFKLLFAGNIGEAQSFPTLMEAAKAIKNMDLPITWIIFGDGRMKESVIDEISNHGLENCFILKGTLPATEMPKYFSCVDGLIVSLRKCEIFSMTIPGKLQSYLACGRPIIGSLDGIGAKIITDANCGFVSSAESVEELVKSILMLYNLTIEDRKLLGTNGRKYFEENFEREYLLNKLDEILHS